MASGVGISFKAWPWGGSLVGGGEVLWLYRFEKRKEKNWKFSEEQREKREERANEKKREKFSEEMRGEREKNRKKY